jgi:hypothetical protein
MKSTIQLLRQSTFIDKSKFDEAFLMAKKFVGTEIRGIKILACAPYLFSDRPWGIMTDCDDDGVMDEYLFGDLILNIDSWYDIEDDSTWGYLELIYNSLS